MKKVLLGVTGSVAAKLTPKLIAKLAKFSKVQVIATDSSLYFWKPLEMEVPVFFDDDEFPGPIYQKENPIPHIALGEWADLFLIAPLTYNTLGKMANGLANNLVTSTFAAWFLNKPIVIAPAMNTRMWNNQICQANLHKLLNTSANMSIVPPVAKRLACGETGIGAMADISDIGKQVRESLIKHEEEETCPH